MRRKPISSGASRAKASEKGKIRGGGIVRQIQGQRQGREQGQRSDPAFRDMPQRQARARGQARWPRRKKCWRPRRRQRQTGRPRASAIAGIKRRQLHRPVLRGAPPGQQGGGDSAAPAPAQELAGPGRRNSSRPRRAARPARSNRLTPSSSRTSKQARETENQAGDGKAHGVPPVLPEQPQRRRQRQGDEIVLDEQACRHQPGRRERCRAGSAAAGTGPPIAGHGPEAGDRPSPHNRWRPEGRRRRTGCRTAPPAHSRPSRAG